MIGPGFLKSQLCRPVIWPEQIQEPEISDLEFRDDNIQEPVNDVREWYAFVLELQTSMDVHVCAN